MGRKRAETGPEKGGNRAEMRGVSLLLAGFLGGVVGGAWWYFGWSAERTTSLEEVMQGYFRVVLGGGGTVGFVELFFHLLRWPFLAWLLGWTSAGSFLLPLLFAGRGFLLAASAFALSAAGGGGGVSFLLVGLDAVLTMPLFFLQGAQSRRQAAALRPRLVYSPRELPKAFWRIAFVGLIWVGACALLEMWALPPLLRGAAALSFLEP